ncbi:MAG: NAD(P)H-dependent glycerol-3-phosphate dehydrogenase, partial [Vicinamibacterales bacterium]
MSIRSVESTAGQTSVSVIGAGAWGTTLANLLAGAGRSVNLIAHVQEHADDINAKGENARYLPGVTLDARLVVTADLATLISASIVVIVTPAQRVRSVAEVLRDVIAPSAIVVCAAKGLELGTLLRMSRVIIDAAGVSDSRVCALSGPNLAGEIARGLPASTVIACSDDGAAREAQRVLATPAFRVYTGADVVGVELGGALKNIVALGAGAVDGMGLGQNAKAALVTRG